MRTVDPDKYRVQQRAILAAAMTCFARNGFHRTSTETIRAEAGMSSGKLFHYFPNKKAIILAVVEEQNRQMAVWLESFVGMAFPSALVGLLDGILHLAGHGSERRLILEISAEAARDAEVEAVHAEGDRLLARGLSALLVAAAARGEARPLIPDDHAVRFLMALIDGIFSRVAVDPGFDPASERAALLVVVRTVLGVRGDDRDAG